MEYAQQNEMQQQQAAHAHAMQQQQQQQQQQQLQMQAYANANGGLQLQAPQQSPQHPQQQQQQVGVVSSSSGSKRSSKGAGGAGVGGQQHPPSKVLHIRGLPPYTSESDVVSYFSALPGVSVTRILLLPNSNQAFLQLASPAQAAHLVALQQQQGGHFLLKPNKAVIVQFSNRHEIHTPATMAAAGIASGSIGGAGPVGAGGLQSSGGVGHDSQQQANSILIVTVLNTRVPVTLDHIHQIFKPYGEVLKIITFHKNGIFKALVQLSSVDAAVNARLMLEGKDIFQGCCHLRIGFSSLHELHVKAPGNNARDFTSPSGATQPFGAEGGAGGYGTAGAGYQQQSGLINSSSSSGYGGAGGYSDQYHSSSSQQGAQQGGSHPIAPPHPSAPGCVVLVSNLPDVRVSCDVLFTLFGVYGDVQRVKILYNKRDTALIQFMSPQSAYLAALHLNHLNLYGKQISVTPSKHVEVSLPKPAHNGGTQADQEQHLSGLTQDYSHSPMHRFKRSAGAAGTGAAGGGLGIHAKSIHPPSQVLHVSSLADAVTEDELRQLFSSQSANAAAAAAAGGAAGEPSEEKAAHSPPVVQFFTATPRPSASGGASAPAPKSSKQAFVRFENVSAAVEALIDFFNFNLHGRYLRISFSAKDPAQVHDTLHGVPIQPQQGQQQQQQSDQSLSPNQQQQQQQQQPQGSTSVGSPSAQGNTGEGQAANQE